jgi:hypothetical protein
MQLAPTGLDEAQKMRERIDQLYERLRQARHGLVTYLCENAGEEVRALRFPTFARLCDTVYQAAKDWHKYENDFSFYFWPGYDSIREDGEKRQRMQLCVHDVDLFRDMADGVDIACGISPPYPLILAGAPTAPPNESLKSVLMKRRSAIEPWLPKNGPCNVDGLLCKDEDTPSAFRLLDNPTSIWFSILLREPDAQKNEKGKFIPGSTHRWLSESDPPVRINSKNNLIPRGLIVDYVNDAERHTYDSLNKSPSFLTFQLTDLNQAGTLLGTFLDNEVHKGAPSWPARADGIPLAGADAPNLVLRRAMYTPWLIATFQPKNAEAVFAACDQILKDLPDDEIAYIKNRLTSFKAGIKMRSHANSPSSAFINDWSSYHHWYSLVMDDAPGRPEPDVDHRQTKTAALGTAMLFSDLPLEWDFLTFVRSWLEQMLLLLRQFEVRKVWEEHGAQVAEAKALQREGQVQRRIENDLRDLLARAGEVSFLALKIQSEMEISKEKFLNLRDVFGDLFETNLELFYGVVGNRFVIERKAEKVENYTKIVTIHSSANPGAGRTMKDVWMEYAKCLSVAASNDNGVREPWLHKLAESTNLKRSGKEAFDFLKILLHRPHFAPNVIYEVQLAFAVRHATAGWQNEVPVRLCVEKPDRERDCYPFKVISESDASGVESKWADCASWILSVKDCKSPSLYCLLAEDEENALPIPGEVTAGDVLGAVMRLCDELRPDQGGSKLFGADIVLYKHGSTLSLECDGAFNRDAIRLDERAPGRGLRSCLLMLCRAVNQRQVEINILVKGEKPPVDFRCGLCVWLGLTKSWFQLGLERKRSPQKGSPQPGDAE